MLWLCLLLDRPREPQVPFMRKVIYNHKLSSYSDHPEWKVALQCFSIASNAKISCKISDREIEWFCVSLQFFIMLPFSAR